MQKYEAVKPVHLNGGRVELDKDQARRRKLKIKVFKKPVEAVEDKSPYVNGIYDVLEPIVFKKGEVFGWDGDFGRALSLHVNALSKEDAEEKAKPPEKVEKPEVDPAPLQTPPEADPETTPEADPETTQKTNKKTSKKANK